MADENAEHQQQQQQQMLVNENVPGNLDNRNEIGPLIQAVSTMMNEFKEDRRLMQHVVLGIRQELRAHPVNSRNRNSAFRNRQRISNSNVPQVSDNAIGLALPNVALNENQSLNRDQSQSRFAKKKQNYDENGPWCRNHFLFRSRANNRCGRPGICSFPYRPNQLSNNQRRSNSQPIDRSNSQSSANQSLSLRPIELRQSGGRLNRSMSFPNVPNSQQQSTANVAPSQSSSSSTPSSSNHSN